MQSNPNIRGPLEVHMQKQKYLYQKDKYSEPIDNSRRLSAQDRHMYRSLSQRKHRESIQYQLPTGATGTINAKPCFNTQYVEIPPDYTQFDQEGDSGCVKKQFVGTVAKTRQRKMTDLYRTYDLGYRDIIYTNPLNVSSRLKDESCYDAARLMDYTGFNNKASVIMHKNCRDPYYYHDGGYLEYYRQ